MWANTDIQERRGQGKARGVNTVPHDSQYCMLRSFFYGQPQLLALLEVGTTSEEYNLIQYHAKHPRSFRGFKLLCSSTALTALLLLLARVGPELGLSA
jgi:hypothetical protein